MIRRLLHIQKVTGIAGSERHLLTLLPRLDRARFDVSMLVLEDPSRPVDEFAAEMSASGIPTVRVPIAGDVDPLCWLRVRRAIGRARVDLVHTHLIHGDLYGTSAAITCGVPHIISTKHGYDNYDRTSRWYRASGLLARRADAVVTISDALQPKVADAEGIPLAKMRTIHYGIDCAADRSSRRASSKLELLAVGRLVAVKGLDYLVRAVALVRAQGLDVRLTLAGDGPERRRLEALVRETGQSDAIRFLGWRTDVRELCREADVFVTASLGEGFGLAVLEAMCAGLPVIATDTMALPELVVRGETGWLVPPRDVEALVGAIVEAAQHADIRERFSVAGRRRAEAEFSTARMVQQFGRLYDSVLETA